MSAGIPNHQINASAVSHPLPTPASKNSSCRRRRPPPTYPLPVIVQSTVTQPKVTRLASSKLLALLVKLTLKGHWSSVAQRRHASHGPRRATHPLSKLLSPPRAVSRCQRERAPQRARRTAEDGGRVRGWGSWGRGLSLGCGRGGALREAEKGVAVAGRESLGGFSGAGAQSARGVRGRWSGEGDLGEWRGVRVMMQGGLGGGEMASGGGVWDGAEWESLWGVALGWRGWGFARDGCGR
mmetsp:Transcript_39682/g.97232  ORF Transcript_39682/g.97232 Transcript_39682/m.97232 type:complete len:239 (+) Transcript_39682:872-1588(+)